MFFGQPRPHMPTVPQIPLAATFKAPMKGRVYRVRVSGPWSWLLRVMESYGFRGRKNQSLNSEFLLFLGCVTLGK